MTKHSSGRTWKHALPCPSNVARLAILAMAMSVAVPSVFAQSTAGTVTGRVLNASTGMYLGKAVVTVEGTSISTLTDDYGYFELRDVPAGKANLKITYTGLQPTTDAVAVTAGETVNRDIKLSRAARPDAKPSDKDVVALETFVVSTDRFSNAAEIAINEERYSPTIKNVVSADAFGDIPDGNIGEFVKYIPGVQIGYGYDSTGMNAAASNATSISVRGFGPEMTNITIDGVPVTNASPATLTRAIGLDMQSINNASRVEVIKVPTPDMPSNSPGGSINLITKSASEYSKPFVSWKLSMNVNSEDFDSIGRRTPGPANKASYKSLPGAEFSYIVPLSSKMGFAFTGAWSKSFNENHRAINDWNLDLKDISSSSTYKLDLTPGGGPNIDMTGAAAGSVKYFASNTGQMLDIAHPALYRFQAVDTPNTVDRTSGSMKFDWRPSAHHKIAVGISFGIFDTVDAQRRLQFYPNRAYLANWGQDFSESYAFIAKGTVVNGKALTADFNPNPQVNQTVTTRDRSANSQTGYIDYVYARGAWKIDANINKSKSRGSYTDMENGHFSELETNISGGYMAFRDIKSGIPGYIEFKDKAGLAIDWSQLANWKAPSISAKSGLTEAEDGSFNAKINIRRDLDFLPTWLTMSAKTGFYREVKDVRKWGLGTGYKMTYYGPTLALTDYLDDGYINIEPGFNLPPQQWLSTYKLYQLWQDNPSYFNADSDADKANNYVNWANQQKKLKETSDQYYIMLDGRTLRNRLNFVFGVRKEIAKRQGYATKTDGSWNYVKNPDGSLYTSTVYPTGVKIDSTSSALFKTDAAGTALRADLTAKGITYPTAVVPNNSYAMRQLNLIPFSNMDGKVTGKPTYTASFKYEVTKDITATLSWNRSQARPDFENGLLTQSQGFNFTTFTTPNSEGYIGTVKIPNPNLKPWSADSWDLQIAYYSPSGGKFSVGAFQKDTKNFQESVIMPYGSEAFNAALIAQGYDPTDFEGYQMTTTINGTGTSTTRGYELEASQNLGVLGRFGSMFHVFGSVSHHYIQQVNTTLMSAKPTSGTTASGGVSFSTPKRFSLMVRFVYLQEKYLGSQATYTYNGNDYIVARYNPSQVNIDLIARYKLSDRYSLFFNARNIVNSTQDTNRYDKTGIMPGYAQLVNRNDFGVNMVFGINGSF